MAVTLNASTSSGFIQSADTSGTLQLQSNGTTQQTIDSTGSYGQLKASTAVASTSGTSIDFTSIPSWVKRITVMFNAVSTTGTAALQIQLFASTILVTSGYNGYSVRWGITPSNVYTASSTAFVLSDAITNTQSIYGTIVLSQISGNTWVINGSQTTTNTSGNSSQVNGANSLSSVLTGVRITTTNGTDTFDAGTINILYEG